MNHDLLNLIGAIRGYAEMLHEDIALLHPALPRRYPRTALGRGSTQAADAIVATPPLCQSEEAGCDSCC